MKRIFSLLLALALMCTMLPLGAAAAETDPVPPKLVALTFDDGPHATHTPKLLDGLQQRGVVVTFFVLGQNVPRNQDIVRRAYQAGHEIACHTWDHPDLTTLTSAQMLDQINRTYEALDAVCGTGNRYLVRPPYGSINEAVRQTIPSPLILWSVDPEDWKYKDVQSVRSKIVEQSQDGDIILVHDIHATTIDGVLMAIDDMLADGYEFVTVSELHRRRGETLENGMRTFRCPPTGNDLPAMVTPEITYKPGRGSVEISLHSEAPIYYTIDGSEPTAQSPRYTQPFTVSYDTQIKAVAAYQFNGSRSATASWKMDQIPCETPVIVVQDGVMTMSCGSFGSEVYYTLDATPATADSLRYTGPVALEGACEIRAVAGGSHYRLSRELKVYCSQRWNLFADIQPGQWFFEAIDRVAAAGIMQGMGGYHFAPNENLTRGQLVTMLYRYHGQWLDTGWVRTNTFADVAQDQYYAEPVEWAFRNGIVQGDSPEQFRPLGNITREELCKVVSSFLAFRGKPLPEYDGTQESFADQQDISPWAMFPVLDMMGAGLIQGDENHRMNPRGTATRAQVATILSRVMDYEIQP